MKTHIKVAIKLRQEIWQEELPLSIYKEIQENSLSQVSPVKYNKELFEDSKGIEFIFEDFEKAEKIINKLKTKKIDFYYLKREKKESGIDTERYFFDGDKMIH